MGLSLGSLVLENRLVFRVLVNFRVEWVNLFRFLKIVSYMLGCRFRKRVVYLVRRFFFFI